MSSVGDEMNHTLGYKGSLDDYPRVRYLCCGHRSWPSVNLLDFTYIFHFTHCGLCAAAQPGKHSQLVSDYLKHEFHGLLELYLLHRICPLSVKQGQSHLFRQQFFSHMPRSLDTILIINYRLCNTNK